MFTQFTTSVLQHGKLFNGHLNYYKQNPKNYGKCLTPLWKIDLSNEWPLEIKSYNYYCYFKSV